MTHSHNFNKKAMRKFPNFTLNPRKQGERFLIVEMSDFINESKLAIIIHHFLYNNQCAVLMLIQ